jgi:hypothetical protein
MAVSWTKEKIDALTVQEISALQENARIRGNDEIMNLCKEVLSTKKPARKARTSSTTKTLEAECSHQLSEFAANCTQVAWWTSNSRSRKVNRAC